MRILHVTDRLSGRGGADWHLLGVLEQQAGRHEVRLAVGRVDGSAVAPCPVERVPGLDDACAGAVRVGAHRAAASAARARRRVARVAVPPGAVRAGLDRLTAQWRPDVVHVHSALGPEPLRWAAERGAVATVQDHRCFCPGQGKLTRAGEPCHTPMADGPCRACLRDEAYGAAMLTLTRERLAALQRMPAIVVLSEYMRSELRAVGLPSARVHVIRPFAHGLDGDAGPEGAPCVLYAGRLTHAKGAPDAAEAWRRAQGSPPLVFAGTGPERARLERAGFEVLGWVPHERMARIYRRARALLLPSRWQEPFGIVGLEALSLGVPVVAWDSGGIAEWHPGSAAGARVRWGDVEALGQALAGVLAAPCSRPRPAPPPGFAAEPLMAQLEALYAAVR